MQKKTKIKKYPESKEHDLLKAYSLYLVAELRKVYPSLQQQIFKILKMLSSPGLKKKVQNHGYEKNSFPKTSKYSAT